MQPALEHIEPGRQASLNWRSFEGEGWDFVWHFHPEIELTLITAGRGQRFVGDSIETFGPGDLVLLGPNLPHTWHTPDADEAGEQPAAGSVVIQFDEYFAGRELWERPEAAGLQRLFEDAERGLQFPPNHRGVADLMQAMHDQTGWTRMLSLLQALGELAAEPDAGRPLSSGGHALPPRRDDQRRIEVVRRLIAERYHQPLDQAEVAAAIHLSPSAFSRFFKRMTGRTFVAYVHELRIADACRRLAESERGITEICFDCGFENVSNFNRVFRRLRGESPREFRQNVANYSRE